jgi:hypothetical protein
MHRVRVSVLAIDQIVELAGDQADALTLIKFWVGAGFDVSLTDGRDVVVAGLGWR